MKSNLANNKGRIIEGLRVFGRVERDNPLKCFLKPVPDHKYFFTLHFYP